MTNEYQPPTTPHEHDPVADPAMDAVEQQFWGPMTDMQQRLAQHSEFGLDTSKLENDIYDLSELYRQLGGDKLNQTHNAFLSANDSNREKRTQDYREAIDTFYDNLQKHEGTQPTQEPTPEPVIEPQPEDQSTPATPNRTERPSGIDTDSVIIKPGDIVWYKPKAINNETQPWSTEWKLDKILPPKEGTNPNEVAVVIDQATGKRETISLNTLKRFQRLNGELPQDSAKPAKQPTPRPEKVDLSPINVGDIVWYQPKSKDDKEQPLTDGWEVVEILEATDEHPFKSAKVKKGSVRGVISFGKLHKLQERGRSEGVKTPAAPDAPKPATKPAEAKKPTAPKTGEKTAEPGEKAFDIGGKPGEVETDREREALIREWTNSVNNNPHLSTKQKEYWLKLDVQDFIDIKNIQATLPDAKTILDEKTYEWFEGILNDPTLSPVRKKYMLAFEPGGPRRDSWSLEDLKNKLEAEGVNYNAIIDGTGPATTTETTPDPVTPEQRAALDGVHELIGLPAPERTPVATKPINNNREPASTGTTPDNDPLNDTQRAALGGVHEAIGATGSDAKKIIVRREIAKKAKNLPGLALDKGLGLAWWSGKERTESDQSKKAKKIGKKTWSIFAREEKPKSNEKIEKDARKAMRKLGNKKWWDR